jgi:farnesyl-diphosphate farnesyltransferase
MTTDARAPMYQKMYAALADKAANDKRDAVIADLKARGVIKPMPWDEQIEVEEEDENGEKRMVMRPKMARPVSVPSDDLSVWGVIGIVAAVLGSMCALGVLIVWIVVKFSD